MSWGIRNGALAAAEPESWLRDNLFVPYDETVSGSTCTETAAEIYAASLLIADPSGPAERGFLAMLAAWLKLDPGLVEHLHANAPRPVYAA